MAHLVAAGVKPLLHEVGTAEAPRPFLAEIDAATPWPALVAALLPYLLVGIGGFAGANARFVVARVVGAAFDTTSNHSLALYCNWSSTVGTGHSAIVYRTKKTRRN